jgi:hypothetical protein
VEGVARVRVTPPLFDEAPMRECSRWLGDGRHCGAEPFLHVIWTDDLENGLVCTGHAAELDSLWSFFAVHEVGDACGVPGSVFDETANVCRLPDDGDAGVVEVEACVPGGKVFA